MYYRGAHAAILVFDSTSPDSLDKVAEWVEGVFIKLCGMWRQDIRKKWRRFIKIFIWFYDYFFH